MRLRMKTYGGSLKNHFLRRHLQKNNKGMAWQKRGGVCVFDGGWFPNKGEGGQVI